MDRAIPYLRVSTQRQQRSGLGIERRSPGSPKPKVIPWSVSTSRPKPVSSDALERRPELAVAVIRTRPTGDVEALRMAPLRLPLVHDREGRRTARAPKAIMDVRDPMADQQHRPDRDTAWVIAFQPGRRILEAWRGDARDCCNVRDWLYGPPQRFQLARPGPPVAGNRYGPAVPVSPCY